MPSFSERFHQIPRHLVEKVNGASSEETFIYIGRCIADQITTDLPDVVQARDVLDFGCGLGRVIARMMDRAPEARFVGFDIDPQMLHWAGLLVDSKRVQLVSSTLPFADRSFDLITAISVFTHLDATTDFWLSEIRRLLRPNGRAFVTFQDETLYRDTVGGAFSGYEVVGRGGPEGGAMMGTYYSLDTWSKRLGPWFWIEKTAPRGLFGHQSYSVLRRKRFAPNAARLVRAYAASVERELFDLRRTTATDY